MKNAQVLNWATLSFMIRGKRSPCRRPHSLPEPHAPLQRTLLPSPWHRRPAPVASASPGDSNKRRRVPRPEPNDATMPSLLVSSGWLLEHWTCCDFFLHMQCWLGVIDRAVTSKHNPDLPSYALAVVVLLVAAEGLWLWILLCNMPEANWCCVETKAIVRLLLEATARLQNVRDKSHIDQKVQPLNFPNQVPSQRNRMKPREILEIKPNLIWCLPPCSLPAATTPALHKTLVAHASPF